MQGAATGVVIFDLIIVFVTWYGLVMIEPIMKLTE